MRTQNNHHHAQNSYHGLGAEAVLYARVSTKEQEKEGFSIPAQLKLLRSYAEMNHLKIVRELVDVETAKRAGRNGFGEMLAFLKQSTGSCRTILVEKTDRLYRNIKDWVTLDELGLEIHFVKENVVLSGDSRSSEKFIHGIKVLMAKNYIDNLCEETRKGMIEKAEQGISPSRAPMGYVNVERDGKRCLQLDSEQAPLIRQLFMWYGSGRYTLRDLVRKAYADGLVYRKSGGKIPRSQIHKILTNPLYHGEFDWAGKRYKGIHEPIVTKELFDRVQQILWEKSQRRSRKQKHQWAFQGMVSCGHCGCMLTAEKKKSKYVYYHCTGNRGKCPEKYVREEELALQFGNALAAIRMDQEVLDWAVTVLRESHADESRYHEQVIARLQARSTQLQNRIEAMYEDRLDGRVSSEFFDRKSQEWQNEQLEIQRQITKHEQASDCSRLDGARLLELAQKAVALYDRQEVPEKRRLLDFVCSNSTWKSGRLAPQYRKPFDTLVVTNAKYQEEKAAGVDSNDLFDIWLPERDSKYGSSD